MNNNGWLPPDSTYAASTALHEAGLPGLLRNGLVGSFIKSVVGAQLPSLGSDFLSANLLNDIEVKSEQSNQWDVLSVYIQMANSAYRERNCPSQIRNEVSEKLLIAANSITPSDNPENDLTIAVAIYDKKVKCTESKRAVALALRTIAQSVIDSPLKEGALFQKAELILEAIGPVIATIDKPKAKPTDCWLLAKQPHAQPVL